MPPYVAQVPAATIASALGASRSSHSLVVIGCPVAGSLPKPHQYPSSCRFSLGIDPSTTSTNGSSSPRSALRNHSRKSSAPPCEPHSKSISGQCTATFGSPGSAPSAISSMLGWVAAVRATESPSQLSPALIQSTWTVVCSAATASAVGMAHIPSGPAALESHHAVVAGLVSLCGAVPLVLPPTRPGQEAATGSGSRRPTARSQPYQAPSPSPARTETGSTAVRGFTARRCAVNRSTSKSTYGSRSVLVSTTRSAVANMCGYFSGFSSPSGVETTTTRTSSPRSNSAGQTRLPTFSTTTSAPAGGSSATSPRATIPASRWQPAPVFTCTARAPAARMRSASTVVSWSPSRTTIGRSACRSAIVRSSSVVFPDPGELMRLTMTAPRARRRARLSSARRAFLASTRSSSTTLWLCAAPSCSWTVVSRVPASSSQPQVVHMSGHLHRADQQVAAARDLHVGAPARAQQDRLVEAEVGPAGRAPGPAGGLGDAQLGAGQRGAVGDQVEAEAQRVGDDAREAADVQPDHRDPGVPRPRQDGVHHALADRELVHRGLPSGPS